MPVDAVLNSHSHEDHVAGNGLFADARVHVHAEDLPGIRSLPGLMGRLRPAARPRVRHPSSSASTTRCACPDAKGFVDGHVFDLGGITVEAVHLPGHTRATAGSACVQLGVLPVRTSTSPASGPITATPRSHLEDFEASLSKVRKEDADYYVTFHHKGVIEDATSSSAC